MNYLYFEVILATRYGFEKKARSCLIVNVGMYVCNYMINSWLQTAILQSIRLQTHGSESIKP